MGLESIELVMDVEDEFGISIPDAVAQQILTVGQLHGVVLPLVRSGGSKKLRNRVDLDAFVWHRVCELSAKLSSGIKPNEISRETRFIEDLGYG